MKIECKVKKDISKNTGNEYIYLSIMIGNYEKRVFLTKSEEELIYLMQSMNIAPQK